MSLYSIPLGVIIMPGRLPGSSDSNSSASKFLFRPQKQPNILRPSTVEGKLRVGPPLPKRPRNNSHNSHNSNNIYYPTALALCELLPELLKFPIDAYVR